MGGILDGCIPIIARLVETPSVSNFIPIYEVQWLIIPIMITIGSMMTRYVSLLGIKSGVTGVPVEFQGKNLHV